MFRALVKSAPVQAILRHRHPPEFDVKIEEVSNTVTAGQHTQVCTVSVSVDEQYRQRHRHILVGIPTPSFRVAKPTTYQESKARVTPPSALRQVRVTARELPRESGGAPNETKTFAVFVYGTAIGKYSVAPYFPSSINYRVSSHLSQTEFLVEPSAPTRLVLISVSPAYKGHGDGSKMYRGGAARLALLAQDDFGNASDDGSLQIKVDPFPCFSFISSTYDNDVGCYVVIIRCNQVGTAPLLSFPGANENLTISDICIVVPPLSASHSYIDPEDIGRLNEQKHVVGRELNLRLHLYDIFGTPLPCSESKVDVTGVISLHRLPGDPAVPNQTHKVRLLQGTPTCEIMFTPLTTGSTSMTLAIHGNNIVMATPMELTVVPEPLFDVKFIKVTDEVIAGQLRQICTVTVSLNEQYKQRHGYVPDDVPRPTIHIAESRASQGTSNVRLTISDIPREGNGASTESIALRINAYATTVGSYSIAVQFASRTDYKVISHLSQAEFHVEPSAPTHLVLLSISPAYGDGCGSKMYRGGSARLSLQAQDDFGNASDDGSLQISVASNPFVILTSSTFDPCGLYYDAIVRCNQVGAALLSFSFPGAHQDLTISNLRIQQDDLNRLSKQNHEVGKEVMFRVELFDIFGAPLPCSESNLRANSFSLKLFSTSCPNKKDEKLQLEENSHKVNLPHGSSTCELFFTPFMNGKRSLTVTLNGKSLVKGAPVEITVVHGPLVAIKAIAHESISVSFVTGERNVCVEGLDESDEEAVSYPLQERVVRIAGRDEFNQSAQLDPNEWSLVSDRPVTQMKVSKVGTALEFHYSFTEKGRFVVTLKSTNNRESYIEVPSFGVAVKSPPLDPERSSVILEQREPKLIFAEDSTPIQLRLALVSLFDCTGNRYKISKLKHDKLTVKVDGDEVRFRDFHTGHSKDVLFTIDDFNGAGCKDIQVCYDRRPFGNKVCVDIVGVERYRQDRYLQLIADPPKIKCTGVPHGELMGPDNANHRRNINRILHGYTWLYTTEQKLLEQIVVQTIQNEVVVDLDDLEFDIAATPWVPEDDILRVLSLFVEGNHYRKQAWSLNKGRIEWRDKAKKAYDRNERRESMKCKEIKEKYSSLMDEGHRRASDAIFNFFNDGRSEMDIDLHGQLVGDEDKLLQYENQLLERGMPQYEVGRLIEETREKYDEAIRQLKQRLGQGFDHPWLEIIYGAGHHSKDGVQKIRPKVINFLTEWGWNDYVKSNKGALLVTLQEYTGTEPCLANFYCQACNKTWESGTSWRDTWQRCYKCDRNGVISECMPFKLRALEERQRRAGGELVVSRRDHRRLCQRCITSGVDCTTL